VAVMHAQHRLAVATAATVRIVAFRIVTSRRSCE
jgi:hypothetical protein